MVSVIVKIERKTLIWNWKKNSRESRYSISSEQLHSQATDQQSRYSQISNRKAGNSHNKKKWLQFQFFSSHLIWFYFCCCLVSFLLAGLYRVLLSIIYYLLVGCLAFLWVMVSESGPFPNAHWPKQLSPPFWIPIIICSITPLHAHRNTNLPTTDHNYFINFFTLLYFYF